MRCVYWTYGPGRVAGHVRVGVAQGLLQEQQQVLGGALRRAGRGTGVAVCSGAAAGGGTGLPPRGHLLTGRLCG